MRLIRITTNYITYLKQIYIQNPSVKDQSYLFQYEYLISDCFGWADFWTHALSKLGHEVWEPVANAEAMQKTWAIENNISFDSNSWLLDIIKHQVLSYNPDVLFVDDYHTFSKNFLNELKANCNSIKLVIGWCGAPYDDEQAFSAYDLVLSNIPELVKEFQYLGHRSQYFKHAFDPRILKRLINVDKTPDSNTASSKILFSFIGSIVAGKLGHNQRIKLLKQLAKNIDIDIFSDVNQFNGKEIILGMLKPLFYDSVNFLSQVSILKSILENIPKCRKFMDMKARPTNPKQIDRDILRRAKKPVFGIEMFNVLSKSSVTFNNHIDISRNSASNMRLFEATGVGTCLLTDWKSNLHELFEPDYEVVTYRSVEECIEKAKWLLDNPLERDKIAKAGQARTLREHTFDNRALVLDEIIQGFLKKK